jgi:DNA-binding transcriptional LysR family regulator
MSELEANDLIVFARVAEAGSFSGAARRLGVPTSTVSRRIAALETQFRERLLHRSSRKLALTDLGLDLLGHARALAAGLEEVQALAHHRQAQPSGRLRVSLPSEVGSILLPRMLARFVHDHPGVTLEVDLSPRRVDLIAENFDLALRFGELGDDAQLAVRKLVDMSTGLYAAPEYLMLQGTPKHPDDLLALHGLLLPSLGGDVKVWELRREGRRPGESVWTGVPVRHSVANSAALLMRMAEACQGVVGLPDFLARESVEQRRLQRVLPGWSLPTASCSAVFPGRRLMPARTRAFIDALVACLSNEG